MFTIHAFLFSLLALPPTAEDRFYRGRYFYGTYYTLDDIDFDGGSQLVEFTFLEDGTYEWVHSGGACEPWERSTGVWTNLGEGFLIEDFDDTAPIIGRFRGARALGLYLDPAGEWLGWALHKPGSRAWLSNETVLWGRRSDGTEIEFTLEDDGTCYFKEAGRSCFWLGTLCTWTIDATTGLPLVLGEDLRRFDPSPLPEPGCFHYDDGGLGVDVCAY